MKGTLAWIIFTLAAGTILVWVASGVRDNLRERAVFQQVIDARAELAAEPQGQVSVGLAGDWDRRPEVLDGARAAAAELNARGGILGCTLNLLERNDHGRTDDALAIAHELALQPEVPVVIGHTSPQANGFTASNYAFYKVLLFSPCAELPGGSAQLAFTDVLSADQLCQALLDLAEIRGWERVGLIYDRTARNETLTQRLESLADSRGVMTPLAYAFTEVGADLDEHMARWNRELNLDALVLALDGADELAVLRSMRAQGIALPVVLTTQAPGIAVLEDRGAVWVVEPYARRRPKLLRESPVADQLTRHDFALGYETVLLLAEAAEQAGTLVPEELSGALMNLEADGFPAGTTGFTESGQAVKLPPRFVRP